MNPNRRQFLLAFACLVCAPVARAAGWSAITAEEAGQALRDSLGQGARGAIATLGRENGFFGDARLKIGLHKNLAKAERYLRAVGLGKRLDDLVLAMNRAAEAAVPQLGDTVLETLRGLRVNDAKAILAAGDGAATAWFREHTETRFGEKLAPIIHDVAARTDLARAYDALSGKLAKLAGLKSELATVEAYVVDKTLDGLYTLVAEEERALRARPLDHATGLVGKVFGLLK